MLLTISAALFAALIVLLGIAIAVSELFRKQGESIEITQLHLFPIKGILGGSVEEAKIGPYGVVGDRTFSLQKVHRKEGDPSEVRYETMLAGYYLQLALFQATVKYDDTSPTGGEIHVVWTGHGTDFDTKKGKKDSITIPLQPLVEGPPTIQTSLHTSDVMAYDVGDEFSQWFSDHLGFETKLVYLGPGSRAVLGSMAPNSKQGLQKARLKMRLQSFLPASLRHSEERLVFNDIAHYLVCTEESNNEVTRRLDEGCSMDVRKFRPNIVVKGASKPFFEDFWGELTFDGGIQMPLTANCYRCQSITVDFKTGKTATDGRGMAWKKLNKDRRVDKGAKYSPVFGRYGYCFGSSIGKTLKVGQKGRVTYVNAERTKFDWPDLTTFGVTQTKK